jgi:hypothetical protein
MSRFEKHTLLTMERDDSTPSIMREHFGSHMRSRSHIFPAGELEKSADLAPAERASILTSTCSCLLSV